MAAHFAEPQTPKKGRPEPEPAVAEELRIHKAIPGEELVVRTDQAAAVHTGPAEAVHMVQEVAVHTGPEEAVHRDPAEAVHTAPAGVVRRDLAEHTDWIAVRPAPKHPRWDPFRSLAKAAVVLEPHHPPEEPPKDPHTGAAAAASVVVAAAAHRAFRRRTDWAPFRRPWHLEWEAAAAAAESGPERELQKDFLWKNVAPAAQALVREVERRKLRKDFVAAQEEELRKDWPVPSVEAELHKDSAY